MSDALTISIVALAVSIASFGLSSYLAWRDRSRLKAKSFAREHDRTGEYSSVFVSVTNAGRRPIILRSLIGIYADGSKGGISLSESGVKLQEGEFYETEFGKFDGIMVNGDEMSPLIDIVIKDSSGHYHKIENSRANVQLISQSKHPFGVRTHG